MTPEEKQDNRRNSYLEKLQRTCDEGVAMTTYLNHSFKIYLHNEIMRNKDFAKTVYDITEAALENLEKIEPENKRAHAQIRRGWLNWNAITRDACENTRER